MTRYGTLFVLVGLLVTASAAHAAMIDMGNLDWSVQYIIDTSQDDFGQPQSPNPRDNRGLAISPDGRYLYLGYNNSFNDAGEVRKIDLTVADVIDASIARLAGPRGKSIAVDDQGRVFLGEGGSIQVYDADLGALQYSLAVTKCEGVAGTRDAGVLYLYATDRTNKTLTKWQLTESGGTVSGGSQVWQSAITGAVGPRGCEVDPSGRIWIADPDADKVFRVNADGTGLVSASVSNPMDVGFDGARALITRYTDRAISVLDTDMNPVGSPVSVPWAELELDPDGQSGGGALSGIVVLPGVGFYVTNETGQTADEKSVYGRIDGNSGEVAGKFYTDTLYDDNDPVLFAVPEPGCFSLLVIGAFALWSSFGRRQRTLL